MGCSDQLGLGTGRMMRYRLLVLGLTFLTYTSFHMSRKAPSIVKGALHPHVESDHSNTNWNPVNNPGWSPFSDDLNPSIVGPKGYTVTGSVVCAANAHYECIGLIQRTDYYNATYCPRFRTEDKAFHLRLIEQNDPVRFKAVCDTAESETSKTTGCWVLAADRAALDNSTQQDLCVNETCILYVQPSGHLIPAPEDDKIGWVASEAVKKYEDADAEESLVVSPTGMTNGKVLLGSCDSVYLIFYAAGLFVSGHIADNMSLRLFLCIGMLGAGTCIILIGCAHVWNIHSLWYFYVIYAIQGLFQATGWPAVVAVMGNWFRKDTRGLVMGIWNAHTSVGNILGSLISGAALGMGSSGNDWAAAFFFSGALIAGMGIIVFLFLPNHPHDVGLPSTAEEALQDPLLNEQTSQEPHELDSDDRLEANQDKPKGGALANFGKALCIPGVVEFALALFFAKFVAYMFIYWLPYYLGHLKFSPRASANLSTAFDMGGIVGGIFAGWLSDRINRRAPVVYFYLVCAVPCLYFYRQLSASIGDSSIGLNILIMAVCGAFVNGPYALITTAVSADLGSHPSLKGDLSLTATVTGIIDGTGSIGASIQGILIGIIASGCNASGQSWDAVFDVLMICCAASAAMVLRLVWKQGPDPDSPWLIAYRAIVLLFLVGLLVVAIYCTTLVFRACGPGSDCQNL